MKSLGGYRRRVVDPVAAARGSVSVIDNTTLAQNRERQRPGPDLVFGSLILEKTPASTHANDVYGH